MKDKSNDKRVVPILRVENPPHTSTPLELEERKVKALESIAESLKGLLDSEGNLWVKIVNGE